MCSALRRAACVALALFLLATLAVPIFASPKIVYRHTGSSEKKRIALTFDDGPHPRYTPQILDILAEFGVEATFFTVGVNAETYPEIVKRIAAEGHEIGNHTYHHYHTASVAGDVLTQDILACSRVLKEQTGEAPRLFRPPEGICNEDITRLCEEQGYIIVMWSVDTRDWTHPEVGEICQNVRQNVRDGSIILMHDFIGKKSPTPAALRRIIPMLQESGFEFVTVSRLLEG